MSASSTRLPVNSRVASTYATGRPSSDDDGGGGELVTRLSRSAWRMSGSLQPRDQVGRRDAEHEAHQRQAEQQHQQPAEAR